MWDFLTSIVNSLGSLASFVANFFVNFLSAIGQALTDLWNNFLAPAFDAIGSAFINVISAIGDGLSSLGSAIGGFFISLWTNIFNFFAGIPEFFSNFWNSFTSFLVGLFVPEEGYFDNTIENLKIKFTSKIDFTEYVRAFINLEEITSGDTAGLDVNFSNYRVGDTGAVISTPRKWIDFDFILKFKETWFSWCRAVTWLFFIIYNINQVSKILWGKTTEDGGNLVDHFNSSDNYKNTHIGFRP